MRNNHLQLGDSGVLSDRWTAGGHSLFFRRDWDIELHRSVLTNSSDRLFSSTFAEVIIRVGGVSLRCWDKLGGAASLPHKSSQVRTALCITFYIHVHVDLRSCAWGYGAHPSRPYVNRPQPMTSSVSHHRCLRYVLLTPVPSSKSGNILILALSSPALPGRSFRKWDLEGTMPAYPCSRCVPPPNMCECAVQWSDAAVRGDWGSGKHAGEKTHTHSVSLSSL